MTAPAICMSNDGRHSMRSTILYLAAAATLAAISGPAMAQTGGGPQPQLATATFAGGCFWCMEAPFDKLDGVVSVTVGYTGGTKTNPTYEQVSAGSTGHAESVQLTYDPGKIGYPKQLEEASKAELAKSGRFKQPIVTEIVPASTFWPAEDYHQHYYLKNPLRYKFYRTACGRDRRLEELWGRQDRPS